MGLMAHCRITEDRLSIKQGKVTAMSEPRRIGYLRISPTDRTPNVQADALAQAGYTKTHQAAAPMNTGESIKQLLDQLGEGDRLLAYRLDRLARDEHRIINLQQQLDAMGIVLIITNDQEATGGNHADYQLPHH